MVDNNCQTNEERAYYRAVL